MPGKKGEWDVMKRTVFLLLCILLAMGLGSCGGNIDHTESEYVESEMYSQEDIESAIDTIKNEFDREWKGCSLTEIYYAGDEKSRAYQEWAERHQADEVIVLLSSFDVDESGGDGSLNPNSTYSDWNWILVRDTGGKWEHVDHGY